MTDEVGLSTSGKVDTAGGAQRGQEGASGASADSDIT